MKKKLISMLLCLSMAVTALAGCNSSTQEIRLEEEKQEINITFSWWGSDSRHEYTIEAIREFEKKYPYINVELEYSEFTGFELKTSVKMAAHTEADVMQLNYAWVDLYSHDGNGLYDLNKVSDIVNLGNYTETSLSYGMSNGVLNALPIALNGKVFIYNKAIYDKYGLEIPKTWDDLFAAAAKMKKDGVYPLDLDSSAVWFATVAYMEQKTGKKVIDDKNHFNFNESEVQQMLEFYLTMINEGVLDNPSERSDSKLKDGTYAGTLQWVTSAEKAGKSFEEAGGSAVYGDGLTQPGAKLSGWYVKPATMYAISANTAHPEEAALLLEFLVSSEEMATAQKLDKGIPSNTAAQAVLEENGLLTGAMYDASEVMEGMSPALMSPDFESSDFSNALKNAAIDVLYGKATVEEAAAVAYDKMRKAIN